MNFDLKDEDRALKQMLQDFCRKEILPHAGKWESDGEIPSEIITKLGSLGLMGICVPHEFGGPGMTMVSYAIAVKEIACADGSLALTVASHNSLCIGHILHAATKRQKEIYLPPLARGEQLGAWCLTEAGSGSDAFSMRTQASRVDGGWLLNGTKLFITQGAKGDVYVVLAVTDKEKGKEGITAFIVEKGTSGLSVGKKMDKLGMRASDTAEVIFQDLFVSDENVLGEVNKGFSDVLSVLTGGRISIAALSVGLGTGAMRESMEYAKQRFQFGAPISEFQAIKTMVADMATEIDASWLLTLKAAFMRDAGLSCTKESSMAKLFASEAAMRATIKSLQIFGGYGYTEDYPLERFMRDAKLCEIGEGTSEIQRIVISKQLLKGR